MFVNGIINTFWHVVGKPHDCDQDLNDDTAVQSNVHQQVISGLCFLIMIVQHPTVGVIPSKSVTIMQLLFVRFISRTRIVPSIIYVIVLSVAPS